MSAPRRVRLDVWSDYVCPFCYLELPVADRIRRDFGPAVTVEWHAFELRPEPVPTLDPAGEYLRTTWARSVYPMAGERGMVLRLPPVQPRSRKAFEAAEFARDQDRFDAMHHALFRGFFEEGVDIADIALLAELGAGVGLDALSLRKALDEDRYTHRVASDASLAHRLGIDAVPAMLVRRDGEPIERSRAVSGAAAYEQMAGLVSRVLGEGRAAE
jgi:predicted DsbA family dithiol-disulfide isomerase